MVGAAMVGVAVPVGAAMVGVTIGNRVVKAVAQTHPMLIYVNPEAGGFDEWEMPPGSGTRLMVGTPQRLERLEVN